MHTFLVKVQIYAVLVTLSHQILLLLLHCGLVVLVLFMKLKEPYPLVLCNFIQLNSMMYFYTTNFLLENCPLQDNSFSFLVLLLLSLVMGIALNFTMFLCTIVNSALTTTIVGVLKGVGSTTLGFVLLGGVPVHGLNVTGLVINSAGGVWYSYAKYQQKKSKPPKLMSDLEAHRK
ncbi:hypothetical protein JRO89_XS03G0236500 [Xanthoceras sorbifolium]|uniref:Sugar phosphate transporter domain-containing protein n=1 Tax=Xanthoceras sorbifolium TaxID=99658 RepID=A0ABQ8IBH9_9ROSI|nr:hypothetical protein JRO89_XS03G0236500 [Xanthoceras sorbifolium]